MNWPIHSLAILGVGAFLGLIMGLVGVGGGFLLTPIMMFLGIPPPVAVASVATEATATGGGMPKNIMIGVRRKPPPTPTNPIIRPRNAPTPKIAKE